MASLLPCFEQMKSLKNFGNVQQAIGPILAHMEAALKAVLNHSTFNSLSKRIKVQSNKFSTYML